MVIVIGLAFHPDIGGIFRDLDYRLCVILRDFQMREQGMEVSEVLSKGYHRQRPHVFRNFVRFELILVLTFFVRMVQTSVRSTGFGFGLVLDISESVLSVDLPFK